MTDTEIAYRAAINVLRDTIESGRMPPKRRGGVGRTPVSRLRRSQRAVRLESPFLPK